MVSAKEPWGEAHRLQSDLTNKLSHLRSVLVRQQLDQHLTHEATRSRDAYRRSLPARCAQGQNFDVKDAHAAHARSNPLSLHGERYPLVRHLLAQPDSSETLVPLAPEAPADLLADRLARWNLQLSSVVHQDGSQLFGGGRPDGPSLEAVAAAESARIEAIWQQHLAQKQLRETRHLFRLTERLHAEARKRLLAALERVEATKPKAHGHACQLALRRAAARFLPQGERSPALQWNASDRKLPMLLAKLEHCERQIHEERAAHCTERAAAAEELRMLGGRIAAARQVPKVREVLDRRSSMGLPVGLSGFGRTWTCPIDMPEAAAS